LALKKVCSFDIEAIPPYSFELTVHKPAGWWWSTPKEIFEDNTLWTAIRFRGGLMGLKLWSLGTLMRPRIRCSVFGDEEISYAERSAIASLIKRALRTEEDLNAFYEMARKDDILKDVVRDLRGMRNTGMAGSLSRSHSRSDPPDGSDEEEQADDGASHRELRG
jgi:hypothetical protein